MDFPFPGFEMKKSHDFPSKNIFCNSQTKRRKTSRHIGHRLLSNTSWHIGHRLLPNSYQPKAIQFLLCCCLKEELIIVLCPTHMIEVAQSVANLNYLV